MTTMPKYMIREILGRGGGEVKHLNRYIFGIMILLVSLSLSACQPIQIEVTDPAPLSQIQPPETVTDKNTGSSQVVPQAVRDLEGNYVGSWTAFGIDAEGQVVQYFSWTDTIKAENSQMDGEQAYVLTTGEMVFEGSDIPPMKITGREGYFLMPDGSLGDYFVETNGQISTSIQLSENVWTSVTPASSEELAAFGFPNVSSGQHVAIKVVTSEEGIETHRITRVTTVNWTDQAGQDRWLQFVSLQGFHQRQSE